MCNYCIFFNDLKNVFLIFFLPCLYSAMFSLANAVVSLTEIEVAQIIERR